MLRLVTLALSAALPLALTQAVDETVLGVYIFHRHGDRTPKILAPTNLTDLGYRQVYTSGQYYRGRYIDSNASSRISGINSDEVLQSQIQASAPLDTVLQNSAAGFLQALYPPTGSLEGSEQLANGSTVTAPMDGYQLIPVELVDSGTGSEDSGWLQDTSSCYKAELSSNAYFESAEYNDLYKSSADFYRKLLPVLEPTFNKSLANFENAYLIWDYVNVARIHNETIPHSDLLTPQTLDRLYYLSNAHEWGLAYNSSEPIRSIAGKQLGGEVTQFFDSVIDAAGSLTGPKIAVQFGAYASFAAFFGLADLPSVDTDFEGVTNYASSMVFEMFTNTSTDGTASDYPRQSDVYVRFLYRNGTATEEDPPEIYPLFGTSEDVLRYSDFENHMNGFSIQDTGSWCTACGNTTGICEAYASGSGSESSSSSSHGSLTSKCGNGLSAVVNGVIGAMVTLAVVLGLEALMMLALGLRLVKKSTLAAANGGAMVGNGKA